MSDDQNKAFEARLKRQEEAIDALKDVPKLLANLSKSVGQSQSKSEPPVPTWSLGLSDDESDHDDVDKLLGENPSKDDVGLEEVDALLSDIEKGVALGPEILSTVSDSFLKTIKRPLSKESKLKLLESVKIPSNCIEFSPSKINNEIWKILPSHAKLADVKHQQTQHAITSGLSGFATISNLILSRKNEMPKDLLPLIIKTSIDAANILGDQMQQLDATRRFDIKKYLNPEYAGICSSQISHSEWLFGSDLSESLKSSKATSSLMRNTASRGHRFHPYKFPQNRFGQGSSTAAPLNFSRPFRQQRGNGQFRPQGYRYSQNYSTPTWKQNPNRFGGPRK